MIEVKPLKIKKSNVQELKERYKWSGSGTKEDPIEIRSTEDLPGLLYFKTKDLYVRLQSVRHHSIKLKYCQNISIDNSRICHLEMIECWKVRIEDSYIGSIKMEYCKGNSFLNNKIGELRSVMEHNRKEKLGLGLGLMLGFGSFFWILTAYLAVVVPINVLKRFSTIDVSTWIGLIAFMGLLFFFSIILMWGAINSVKTMMRLRKLKPNDVRGNSMPSIDEYRAELCNYCAFQSFCEESHFLNYLLGKKGGRILSIASTSSAVQFRSNQGEEGSNIARQSPKEPTLGQDSYRLRYPKGDFTDLGLIGCALCLIVPLLILFSVAFYGSELGDLFLGVLIFCLVMYAILVVLAYKKVREYKKEKKVLASAPSLKGISTTIETLKCHSCGKPSIVSARYCQYCGSKLQ